MNANEVFGDEPGKVKEARVRCTCGAEINYAEKVCRNGHGQAWMWELPEMVACDDASCEHLDCAQVRAGAPQTQNNPWGTGSEVLFPEQVTQQHYAMGDPRSPALHPGLMKDCTDPECIRVRQRSKILRAVEGVGPDAATETNEHGASQSTALYAFTSLDPHALFRVAGTAAAGDQKYGVDNWRGISERDHVNHALTHIYAHLAGDQTDDHLAHAACRMLMALAVQIQGGPRAR